MCIKDEARPKAKLRFLRHKLSAPLRSQRGQALVEFILVLILALLFTRLVYFNKEFGFKALLDKMMLRLGSFLELNLKSGTKTGPDGVQSLDPYAGTNQWTN